MLVNPPFCLVRSLQKVAVGGANEGTAALLRTGARRGGPLENRKSWYLLVKRYGNIMDISHFYGYVDGR